MDPDRVVGQLMSVTRLKRCHRQLAAPRPVSYCFYTPTRLFFSWRLYHDYEPPQGNSIAGLRNVGDISSGRSAGVQRMVRGMSMDGAMSTNPGITTSNHQYPFTLIVHPFVIHSPSINPPFIIHSPYIFHKPSIHPSLEALSLESADQQLALLSVCEDWRWESGGWCWEWGVLSREMQSFWHREIAEEHIVASSACDPGKNMCLMMLMFRTCLLFHPISHFCTPL